MSDLIWNSQRVNSNRLIQIGRAGTPMNTILATMIGVADGMQRLFRHIAEPSQPRGMGKWFVLDFVSAVRGRKLRLTLQSAQVSRSTRDKR